MKHKITIVTKTKQFFTTNVETKNLFNYEDLDFGIVFTILGSSTEPTFIFAPNSMETVTIDPDPRAE